MEEQPQPTAELIRAQLRLLRTNAGLSQEEYVRRANYSASMVSAVELGQRPLDRVYLARADAVLGTGKETRNLQRCSRSPDEAGR